MNVENLIKQLEEYDSDDEVCLLVNNTTQLTGLGCDYRAYDNIKLSNNVPKKAINNTIMCTCKDLELDKKKLLFIYRKEK